MMELQDVILGFLERKRLTGYELKSLFSTLDFLPWSGNNNQIYTSLIELERKGLVEKRTIQQEKLPAQKRYQITEAGREHLQQASLQPSEAPASRNLRTAALLKTVRFSMQRQKGAGRMKRMIFGRGEILPEVSRFFDLLQQHYVPRFGSPPALSDEQLKLIACPVLMMAGGEDAFFNALKAGARLRKMLPRSEIHIENGGEHGITEYGGRIACFLAVP